MSLDDVVSDVEAEVSKKEYDPSVCPKCGEKGVVTEHWFNRCNTPSSRCDVVTFIPVEPREKAKKLADKEIRF